MNKCKTVWSASPSYKSATVVRGLTSAASLGAAVSSAAARQLKWLCGVVPVGCNFQRPFPPTGVPMGEPKSKPGVARSAAVDGRGRHVRWEPLLLCLLGLCQRRSKSGPFCGASRRLSFRPSPKAFREHCGACDALDSESLRFGLLDRIFVGQEYSHRLRAAVPEDHIFGKAPTIRFSRAVACSAGVTDLGRACDIGARGTPFGRNAPTALQGTSAQSRSQAHIKGASLSQFGVGRYAHELMRTEAVELLLPVAGNVVAPSRSG